MRLKEGKSMVKVSVNFSRKHQENQSYLKRLDELMQIQQEISTEILSKLVGSKQRVIIDREEDSFYIGRTQYDSPDVDCEVLITKVPNIEIGSFYDVTITKADEFDLYATI